MLRTQSLHTERVSLSEPTAEPCITQSSTITHTHTMSYYPTDDFEATNTPPSYHTVSNDYNGTYSADAGAYSAFPSNSVPSQPQPQPQQQQQYYAPPQVSQQQQYYGAPPNAGGPHYTGPQKAYGARPQKSKDENDLTIALVILLVGVFFCPLLLLANAMYLKSENDSVRMIAYFSIAWFVFNLVLGCIIGLIAFIPIVFYMIFLIAIMASAH